MACVPLWNGRAYEKKEREEFPPVLPANLLLWRPAQLRFGSRFWGRFGCRFSGFPGLFDTATDQCRGVLGVEGQASHALLAGGAESHIDTTIVGQHYSWEVLED